MTTERSDALVRALKRGALEPTEAFTSELRAGVQRAIESSASSDTLQSGRSLAAAQLDSNVTELDDVPFHRAPRRKVRVTPFVVAATLCLVGVVVVTSRDDRVRTVGPGASNEQTAGTTSSATTATMAVVEPGATDGVPYLWLSSRLLPARGGPLAVVVINPTSAPVRADVTGELDRFVGSAWEPRFSWRAELDVSGGFGSIVGLGAVPSAKSIPFTVVGKSEGAAEYLMIPFLASGRYRFRMGELSGELVVDDSAPEPPPIDRPQGALGWLSMGSPVLPPSGGRLEMFANVSIQREPDPVAKVQRWQTGSWVDSGTYRLDLGVNVRNSKGAIDLPALPEGYYRVVRAGLVGQFWVSPDVDRQSHR